MALPNRDTLTDAAAIRLFSADKPAAARACGVHVSLRLAAQALRATTVETENQTTGSAECTSDVAHHALYSNLSAQLNQYLDASTYLMLITATLL